MQQKIECSYRNAVSQCVYSYLRGLGFDIRKKHLEQAKFGSYTVLTKVAD